MALAFGAVDGAAADPDGAASADGADGAVEPLLAEALTAAGGSAGATGVLLLELQPSRPAQPRAVRAMANLRSGVTVSIVPWASTPRSTDLNSDVGESFGRWVLGDDEAVLTAVTSANVACGFHAGDPPTCCAVGSATAMSSTVSAREVRGGSVDTAMCLYARDRCTTTPRCSTPYCPGTAGWLTADIP